nr:MAG TPA: hypothetical protein [Caudoviricetes sp.]
MGKKRRLQSVKLVRRKISRCDVQLETPPLVNAHVLVVICSKCIRDNLPRRRIGGYLFQRITADLYGYTAVVSVRHLSPLLHFSSC